jgi:hypothetical protein
MNKADEIDDLDKKLAICDKLNIILAEIRKSDEVCLKFGDRLYLNPSGRARALPQAIEKPKDVDPLSKLLSGGRPQ